MPDRQTDTQAERRSEGKNTRTHIPIHLAAFRVSGGQGTSCLWWRRRTVELTDKPNFSRNFTYFVQIHSNMRQQQTKQTPFFFAGRLWHCHCPAAAPAC